ncbi:MAG TPA: hypothetical protein VFS25_17850 [Chitinophaga sp.]|uniref:hypothetical protein n=1 Tax=Chitinophaga sp. TaxID=1869181 RepID=UPI002DBC33FC|nr:hypothetical protein [Chitinophaga sp.]HEU4554716.1 hypothetical protein [Chitinophaga sp.]
MSQEKKPSDKDRRNTDTKVDHSKKPAEVLKTSKADTRTNPLRADLSEQPTKENKAVRDSEEARKKNNNT